VAGLAGIGRQRWGAGWIALAALAASGGAHAAAQVALSTSSASPVAGGAAFIYTATVTSDGAGASNLRLSIPLATGALFQQLVIGGAGAGAFVCSMPPAGGSGQVTCDAESLPPSTVATVTVTATFDDEQAGGPRTTNARLAFSGAGSPSTAQVQQTLVNNGSADVQSFDGGGISVRYRRLVVQNPGQSAAVAPLITTALPPGAHVLRMEGTRALADRCHFDGVSVEVRCSPQFLPSNAHLLTIVFGMPRRVFRDGFE
jgi:hypothetical protein